MIKKELIPYLEKHAKPRETFLTITPDELGEIVDMEPTEALRACLLLNDLPYLGRTKFGDTARFKCFVTDKDSFAYITMTGLEMMFRVYALDLFEELRKHADARPNLKPGAVVKPKSPGDVLADILTRLDALESRDSVIYALPKEQAIPTTTVAFTATPRASAKNESDVLSMRDAANIMGLKNLGGNNLVKWLVENKVCYRRGKGAGESGGSVHAYNEFIQAGYFKTVTADFYGSKSGDPYWRCSCKLTMRGLNWLYEKLTGEPPNPTFGS